MAGINNLRDKAKTLWIKGMKTVGNTAANIASNTKYKVDEMTLQTRRREIMNDIAAKAYALWLKGDKFPEQMTKMLNELQELDNHLNDLRTEKYSYMNNKSALPEEETDPEDGAAPAEEEKEEREETALPAETEDQEQEEETISSPAEPVLPRSGVSSVQSEINGYFDHSASVGKMAEKVNTSLNQLSNSIKQFAPESEEDHKEQN